MYLRVLTKKEKTCNLDHKKSFDTKYNLTVLYKQTSFFNNSAQHLGFIVENCIKILDFEYQETVNVVNQLKTINKITKNIISDEKIKQDKNKREKFVAK